ncbi:hypothetical protein O6H91_11G042800 [Diphasiastrum complanatum]|uniref:Uncharacterized protein n=1 Tax=Diphasiastrum complanatum TaxID=34168 RepID=A0ACC2C8F2_DIPCM|nr:hypothetical protein O6H91_11G042800 [Diphasiastrum complanatum]
MGRSAKLQLHDGHNGKGVTSILWDVQAEHLITSGSDGRILIHKTGAPLPVLKDTLKHHSAAVTAIAINKQGRNLASGSVDHSVKLYAYPGGQFQSTVTRFTLPIRSLAFSATGGILAAAGDDDGIKLISTVDSSIIRVLKGHDAPVVSLAFDPKNEYLASAGSDGTLIFWLLSSGRKLHNLKHIVPAIDINSANRNRIEWHPDGHVLAVPGCKNDILMLDRDTAEKIYSLKGGHSAAVGFLTWSPNGKYLATAGEDRQVMLWDVENRLDLDRYKLESQICSLSWKPTGNALAMIDIDGKFVVWEAAIPSHMASPTVSPPTDPAMDNDEHLKFSDDEEMSDPDNGTIPTVSEDTKSKDNLGTGLSDEDSDEETFRRPKKLRKKSPEAVHSEGGHGKILTKSASENGLHEDESQWRKEKSKIIQSSMQAPCQPGSTQPVSGKRWFLAYNLLGSITSCENDGLCHVEVEFHDISRGMRVPALTDYFGFTMAALNEKGHILASPCAGKDQLSMVMYRPFNSWANNSEWSMRLPPDEEAKAVAIGDGWVAAATSLHYLRIFSEGGLQKFLLSLTGPVVSMAGYQQQLAVVTHSSNPLHSGDQVMDFAIFDVNERARKITGRLPLSPGALLSWLGFSEAGILSSYDSKGVLRMYSTEYDGCWVPVFSAGKEKKGSSENFWMVGLNSKQVFCVMCKSPDTQPQVAPKPVLSVFTMSLPLVHSDLGADDLENEFLRGILLLSEERARADAAAARGVLDDQEDENILKIETELDRYLLRLIAAACKGDKLVRAMELAMLLSLNKSLEGAIKLANAVRLPALAERLSLLLEERIRGRKSEMQLSSHYQLGDYHSPSPHIAVADAMRKEAETNLSPSLCSRVTAAKPLSSHSFEDHPVSHAPKSKGISITPQELPKTLKGSQSIEDLPVSDAPKSKGVSATPKELPKSMKGSNISTSQTVVNVVKDKEDNVREPASDPPVGKLTPLHGKPKNPFARKPLQNQDNSNNSIMDSLKKMCSEVPLKKDSTDNVQKLVKTAKTNRK